MFTWARHYTLFLASWIQFTSSHRIVLRSVLLLWFHLSLGLSGRLSPSGFPTTVLCEFISLIRGTCLSHLILLDLILLKVSVDYNLWHISSLLFSAASCRFVRLWSEHSRQRPVVTDVQLRCGAELLVVLGPCSNCRWSCNRVCVSKCAYSALFWSLEEWDNSEDEFVLIGVIWLGVGSLAGYCEQGNELYSSIKGNQRLD
jgi:hypothetical protein